MLILFLVLNRNRLVSVGIFKVTRDHLRHVQIYKLLLGRLRISKHHGVHVEYAETVLKAGAEQHGLLIAQLLEIPLYELITTELVKSHHELPIEVSKLVQVWIHFECLFL